MDSFLPDSVKAILFGLIVIVFVLSRLANRFPDVEWLQHFRLPVRQMSDEERERRRRRANLMAGVEIMLAGLVLPLLYLVSKVMMFDEPKPLGMTIVAALSLGCMVLGIWVFVRNVRS